jgi:hypothetical protein
MRHPKPVKKALGWASYTAEQQALLAPIAALYELVRQFELDREKHDGLGVDAHQTIRRAVLDADFPRPGRRQRGMAAS